MVKILLRKIISCLKKYIVFSPFYLLMILDISIINNARFLSKHTIIFSPKPFFFVPYLIKLFPLTTLLYKVISLNLSYCTDYIISKNLHLLILYILRYCKFKRAIW